MAPWNLSIHHISLGVDREEQLMLPELSKPGPAAADGERRQLFWQEWLLPPFFCPLLSPLCTHVSSGWPRFSVTGHSPVGEGAEFGSSKASSLRWVGSCSSLAKLMSWECTCKPHLAPVIPENNLNLKQSSRRICYKKYWEVCAAGLYLGGSEHWVHWLVFFFKWMETWNK